MKAVTSSRELDYRWAPVTTISGTVGIVAYVLVLATESTDGLAVILSFAFAFGVTVSSIGIFQILGGVDGSPLGLIAAVANVTAAALLLAMLLVQISVKVVVPQPDAGLKAVYWGLDVAWDLYFGTGTLLFGLSMFGRRGFGIWFAAPGLLIGGLFLFFNIVTFPDPPANAGLVDLGPLVGLWYLVVCGRLGVSSVLQKRKHRRTTAAFVDSTGVN